MARMFGTDGVRGVANKDLSCELALKIGKAGAYVLTNEVHHAYCLAGIRAFPATCSPRRLRRAFVP